MNHTRMEKQLILHEGLKLKPYKDTVGKWTIGVGRNLTDVGITEDEALMLLCRDIEKAEIDAFALISNYSSLNDVRQRVLVDMAFNLGRSRLSKFKRMVAAVQRNHFGCAADEMVDSKWYRQVGVRGARLELMMRTGKDNN